MTRRQNAGAGKPWRNFDERLVWLARSAIFIFGSSPWPLLKWAGPPAFPRYRGDAKAEWPKRLPDPSRPRGAAENQAASAGTSFASDALPKRRNNPCA